MIRSALIVLGVACIGASPFVPVEPVPAGGHTLEAWWCAMVGVVLLFAAWSRPAALLTLATVGALGLTKPLWLHRPWLSNDERGEPLVLLALAAIGVAGLGVLAVLRGRLRPAVFGLVSWCCSWRWPLAMCLFLGSVAHLTLYEPRGYWTSYAVNVAAMSGAWLVAMGALVAFGTSDAAVRLKTPSSTARLPWILGLWVFLFSSVVARFVLDGVPHIPDGVAYLFQARTFAAGSLWFDAPPAAQAFELYLLDVVGDRWFAVTPPGWPAVLAVGELAGAPWLVNPLLGALTIPATHGLVRRLRDRETADTVALLMAASPWLLFLSASFMTHAVSLLDAVLACLLVIQVRDGLSRWRLVAAGCFMGHLFLVRPLDGLVVGGALALLVWFSQRERHLAAVLSYGAGCVVVGALVFAYNQAMTGDMLTVPIQEYTDRLWYPGANRLGFGADVGNPPETWGELDPYRGHGFKDVLLNANQNLCNLNFELLGWAVGGLLLFGAHVLGGRWTRADRICGVFLLVLAGAYSCYWFSGGPDYGARYWYLMLVPVLWLSARGLQTIVDWGQQRWPDGRFRARAHGCLLLCCAISVVVFLPWRVVGRYDGYRGFHREYLEQVEDGVHGGALIFVRSPTAPEYGSAMLANDPALPGDRPVFVRYRSEAENAATEAAFPGRTVVIVGRPSGR